MRKTICIKTNNKNICKYLLKELEYFEISNVFVSCYNFKFYTNIIIHHIGKKADMFISKFSNLLAQIVIDCYEPTIIKNIINTNYFYFSKNDRLNIYNMCLSDKNFTSSTSSLNIISDEFIKYFNVNKYVILDGFINFRLNKYIKNLDSLIDMYVNKFIVDREYNEFINLLKSYIQSSPSKIDALHLIYKNGEAVLLDDKKNVIQYNKDLLCKKYFSDISFSSNDFALNALLTLLPKKLYIHLLSAEDDFINTLKLVFDNRVFLCTDCNVCNLYKSKYNFLI